MQTNDYNQTTPAVFCICVRGILEDGVLMSFLDFLIVVAGLLHVQ